MASSTGNLTITLVIILLIDVLFLFTQTAITEINPSGSDYFRYNQSLISGADTGGYNLNQTSYGSAIPATESGVTTEGNLFTDSFRTIKGWFTKPAQSLNYFIRFLGGPTSYLYDIGLPHVVTFALGTFWYLLTLFLLLSYLFGRG